MSAAVMARESKGGAQAARKAAGNLRINQPDDAYEREADRVAEEVMAGARRMPSWSLSRVAMPHVQRQCTCGGECEDCKKDKKEKLLQREPAGHESAPALVPLSVGTVLRGAGRPLDAATRAFMESGFGHDFGRVRIFADEHAAASAGDVHANAYTVGEKIVFNRGRYTPGSETGRRLLAHELAHVVQQNGGAAPRMIQRDDEEPHAVVTQQGTGSVLEKAFAAADRGNLPEAVRLANGLDAFQLKYFLEIYKGNRLLMKQLHEAARGTEGVGEKSAIGLKTEEVYKEEKKKEDFAYQKDLAKQNGLPEPVEGAPPPPPPKPLTVEEKKQKCATGKLEGLKTFPIQLKQGMFEFNSAPLSATRTASGVQVSQPQNSVFGNRAFRRDTKTLPLQVFTGGITLANDDVVRVRMYDSDGKPTGKTGCLTGEEMLKVGSASDNATLLAIGSTVVNAASVFVPGAGTVAGKVGTAALQIGVNEGFDIAGQANLVHYGLQDKIDWAQVAFDTLFQVITAGVAHGAGPVAESLADSVSAKAGSAYTRAAIKFGVLQVLPTATAILQTTANQVFNSLRGQAKDMTVREFASAVGEALAQHLLQQVLHAAVGPDAEQQQKNKAHAEEAHEAQATLNQPPATVAQHESPAPVPKKQTAEHHENDAPAPKKSPAKQEMEPEGKSPVKAVPKEEMLDEAPVKIDGKDHEVVAGKKGFGLCSEPPCPAIPVVYREELDSNAEFAARYKAIRKRAETDVKGANQDAVKLVGDMEKVRDVGRNSRNADQLKKMGSVEGDAQLDKMKLGVGKERMEKIQSGDKDFVLDRALTFDIDEVLPVGAEGVKPQRAVKRALDASNRQLLDPNTNRTSKGLGIDPRELAANRKPSPQVSVAQEPSAILTKRFSEVKELNNIFNEAVASVKDPGKLKPTELKAAVNRETRRIITEGKGPDAVAVRKALKDLGFERLPGSGWTMQKAPPPAPPPPPPASGGTP